ncbi:two-CW domain-containing protein [Bacteroidota bacterium]
MERNNCWEIMKCDCQPGGKNEAELGVCLAALPNEFDNINQGKYGGRFCRAVAGTVCGGEVQGTYAMKLKECLDCEFLIRVQKEEARDFILMISDARDVSK